MTGGAGRSGRSGVALLASSWLWLGLFVMAPLAIVLTIALARPADSVPPFVFAISLENLTTAITDPVYQGAFWLSLRTAFWTALACLLVGYPMALGIALAAPRWRAVLLLALMLPFWTGFLMRINAWIGLLRDDGLVSAALALAGFGSVRLLYTNAAMYVGLVYTYLPFMVLPLYARLAKMDPALNEAAADLGSGPLWSFVLVTLPLSVPGIVAGLALVFIPCAGEYVIPALLGGPGAQLLGRVLWETFFNERDWPMAAALAWVMLLAFVLVPSAVRVVAARLARRREAAADLS